MPAFRPRSKKEKVPVFQLDDVQLLSDHLEKPLNKQDPDSKALVSNSCIGVEIELESATHIHPVGVFRAEADGSLRNEGVEFVFARPASGQVVIDSLKALQVACTGTDRDPTLSVRTSVHVHVDCLDMTADQISRMITLYEIFEVPLFRAFAPTRINNHFCTRITECYNALSAQRYLSEGFESFFNRFEARDNQRYCALNLRALSKFGTVEFRHHPGSYNADDLILWINACLSLKRAAEREIDFVGQFFSDSTKGWDTQLRDTFPVQVVDKINKTYAELGMDINNDIVRGIRYAQNALTPKLRFA